MRFARWNARTRHQWSVVFSGWHRRQTLRCGIFPVLFAVTSRESEGDDDDDGGGGGGGDDGRRATDDDEGCFSHVRS